MTLLSLGLEAWVTKDREHLQTIFRHLNRKDSYKLVSMIREYELLQLPYEMQLSKRLTMQTPIDLSYKEIEMVKSFL